MQATTTAPAPAPALRPLGVGDVVDRVFRLYRDRPLGLFLLGAIPFVVFLVGYFALTVWLVAIVLPVAGTFQRTADPLAILNNRNFIEFIGAAFVYIIALSIFGLALGFLFGRWAGRWRLPWWRRSESACVPPRGSS